jgi:Asp-tRNA(Asn)/Glu-tRNA(Gln) amidotransferase A subunit family amidase
LLFYFRRQQQWRGHFGCQRRLPPFGIGNDIGGSIRIPATMCGIFGLKPTNFPDHTLPVDGLVPDFSAYHPAIEQLSNGPLARYADDLPLVLSVRFICDYFLVSKINL